MTPAINQLVKKNLRNGRNVIAATVDMLTFSLALGALLLAILWSLLPLPSAAAFAAAGVIVSLGIRQHLTYKGMVKARQRVEKALFERCFANDLLNMDAKVRGATLAMILAGSAMRVREDGGILLTERQGKWLPVVFICMPMEETITRRDVWSLTGRMRARGYDGALVITTGAISEPARTFAKQSTVFKTYWMGFSALCGLAKEAGFTLEQARLEQTAKLELENRPKPRRFHELLHPRHIRRIAFSGLMLLILSFLTAWPLYYRLAASAMLALAAFLMIQLHYGRRKLEQEE